MKNLIDPTDLILIAVFMYMLVYVHHLLTKKSIMEIEIHDEEILVDANHILTSIDKQQFFDFVDRHGYNQWVHDYNDPAQFDGHGQTTGKYDYDDYFHFCDDDHIKDDLIKYLQYHKIPLHEEVNS